MAKLQRIHKKDRTLRPVRPNAGLQAVYQKKMDAMIEEMHQSVVYFLKATYRANEPRIVAQDETPADALRRTMKELVARWTGRFDAMSKKLAVYFAKSVESRSSAALKKILNDGGWTVEFQITPAMRDVMAATVQENVSLIKSIPQQYLGQVEGIVMRGAQTGRDIGQIAKDLHERLGVTKRRAAFIARDQTEKTTAAFTRARHLELGITEAEWVHSSAGKEPRPSHVKAGKDRARYNIAEGWLDPATGKRIWPGTEINCRCVGRPIIPGFS